MPSYRFCVLCAVMAAVFAMLMAMANSPSAAAAEPVSFIRDVAPILKENCFSCHDAKKKSGKLEMTSFATLRHGGVNDDPVVPGKPEESELIAVLSAEGKRLMPPKDAGGPLPAAKVAMIERWIREGAALDAGIDPKDNLLRELRKRWLPPQPRAVYPAPVVVNALAYSPDSALIATGGYYELNVWNAVTGKLLKRLRTRAERAYGMAFLSDGLLAVAGGRPGQEGDLRVYDLSAAGALVDGVARLDGVNDPKVLIAHLIDTDDSVLCVAVSGDGKQLAAGGCDRTARVWDISNGVSAAKLTAVVETHADWVLGVAFAGDGRYLLTAGRDKAAKSYDLAEKKPALSFPDHQAAVNGLAVRGDGKVGYSVGADRALRFWKVDGDGKPIKAVGGHGDEILRVAVHPKLPFVVTASADKTVRVWKEDGQAVRSFAGLTDVPFALAISPDGKRVAAAGYGGDVKNWRFPSGELLHSFNASPGYVAKK